MLKKIGRFCAGLLLLPLTLATLTHVPSLFQSFLTRWESLWPLGLGILLYVGLELIFSRPMRTYVLGHELTHALASLLCGGKIHRMKVSKNGGSVTVSKSNFFVALAPYCFPLYTALILLSYYGLGFWWDLRPYYPIYLGLIGFSLAFHASLTIYAMRQDQPDIKQSGIFFSLVVIALANLWVLALLSKLLFRQEVQLLNFLTQTIQTQILIWQWLIAKGIFLWQFLKLQIVAGSSPAITPMP